MFDTRYPDVTPGPPRPSAIVQPRAFSLPPGTERYVVEGAGAILVQLEAGDVLEVENVEGGQPCEIVCADKRGRIDAGLIGERGQGAAHGLMALLASGDASLRSLRLGLEARGLTLSGAQAVHLFRSDSPAGTKDRFTATRDGIAIVAAPGGIMDFEAQDTATPLVVHIRRAVIKSAARFALPDPLADPVSDIRVHSATAEAYFVKAGDYIQILDVDGRQCTDFQCFAARKLDKGLDHALDVTTTRTLMGHAYPMPGLHAKYYDQDMLPLVEVIQDTCGRHDAFALAPHGVPGRAGWMAINFFFNTGLDEHGVLYTDEPWSRPGDYVLLRALTDLVCVSSACPDDTTAANGWNLTDIHVRTYSGKDSFQRAVAYRPTPDADPKMTKQTGFHDRFARFTDK